MNAHFKVVTALLLAASWSLVIPASAQTVATPAPAAEPQPTAGNIRWVKQFEPAPQGAWEGPRLADGQPDIQGFYSNTISNHSNFTDPQAGPPGEASEAAALPRDQRAPSRVTDPPDGEIPYRPEARALQADFARNFAIRPRSVTLSRWRAARQQACPSRSCGTATRSGSILVTWFCCSIPAPASFG
jgi:hypothetical protein